MTAEGSVHVIFRHDRRRGGSDRANDDRCCPSDERKRRLPAVRAVTVTDACWQDGGARAIDQPRVHCIPCNPCIAYRDLQEYPSAGIPRWSYLQRAAPVTYAPSHLNYAYCLFQEFGEIKTVGTRDSQYLPARLRSQIAHRRVALLAAVEAVSNRANALRR